MTGRRDRIGRGLLALAVVAAVAIQVPEMVRDARAVLPVARLWKEPAEQYRLALGRVPYDLLVTADSVLPRDATVLLITPGTDVRHREYETFHRALYFLTPRPIHWITPAPNDGTWEARWWTTAALTRASICAEAERAGATHLLLVGVDPPTPPCPRLGADAARYEDGAVVGVVGGPVAEPAPVTVERAVLGGLAALLIPLVLGGALVALAARRVGLHGGQRLALAWALGAGVVSLADTALGGLGVSATTRMALFAAATVALAAVAGRRWLHSRRPWSRPRPGWPTDLGWPVLAASVGAGFVVSGLLALVALLAIGRPLVVWDGWAIWAMKARTIFVEGRVTEAVFADQTRASAHPAYPLNVPALEAWLFNWIGAPDDRLVGLLSLATYACLLAFVYGTMRHWGAGRTASLATTAVLGSVIYLWRISAAGFADVPLALLLTAAGVLLIEWFSGRRRGVLLLAAISAGLLPWTKMEGAVALAVLVGVLLALGIYRRGSHTGRSAAIAAVALFGAGVCLAGAWWAVALTRGAGTDVYRLNLDVLAANTDRLPTIAAMQLQMLGGSSWGFIWLAAFGLVAVLALRRALRGAPHPDALPAAMWLLPACAALYLALMSGAYVVTTFAPYTEQIESSGYRLALQVLPLVILWMASRLDRIGAPRAASRA